MSDDKTEDATEHKLKKSREEGQVAKSADLATAVSMLVVLVSLKGLGDSIFDRLKGIVRMGLEGVGDLSLNELYRQMGSMFLQGILVVFPLAYVAAFAAATALVAQVGVLFAMAAVTPKPGNIDPAQGLKKIFSVKSLITLGFSVVKAIVLGIVAWQLVLRLLPLLGGSTYQSVIAIGQIAWSSIYRMLLTCLAIFVLLGFADFALQRWQFMKGQKMSKDEVKREHKGQEGDPEIKGQRKQLMHELAEEDPKAGVKRANAVVVNPTHYAVALRYDPEEYGLPYIVAKGVDEAALKIRRYAEDAGVPIFSNPPLARALHKTQLGDDVPEALLEAVAAVLRWVDAMAKDRKGDLK
jgi:type III secretion protein U